MFREQMNHMNLENEFKNLGLGLNQSLKSGLNILKIFGLKVFKNVEVGLFALIDPPRIHRRVGPGQWEEVERRLEHSHHHHPPNLR